MFDLWHGDCLELMKDIPDNSVDMVLTDPPYGTTACKWDTVIDFELMWEQLKRITKDNGAICLFGSEPFSSHLRLSNIKMFKYDWIWNKKFAGNFATAKKVPMKTNEIISVFYSKNRYYPQMIRREKPIKTTSGSTSTDLTKINANIEKKYDYKYPITILDFPRILGSSKEKVAHPTQKPVVLLEYLIKTYTLENETVLDFTMGSGSTGVAAKNLSRKFIGIEKEEKYYNIAKERINV
jgi:DNA modification methylase